MDFTTRRINETMQDSINEMMKDSINNSKDPSGDKAVPAFRGAEGGEIGEPGELPASRPQYPVEGMTVMPRGMPELREAWGNFAELMSRRQKCIDRFCADTGNRKADTIDESYGIWLRFLDWVTETGWGVEGETEPQKL